MSWLLNGCYLLLLVCVSPVLLYRSWMQGKYRDGWSQKLLGKLPAMGEREAGRDRIWFHAVSVGEVLLLDRLVEQLVARSPSTEVVITTTTSTGHALATQRFAQHTVCYFPLDFSWAVKNALVRINPTKIVLVELELWPNFIRTASAQRIPLVLINGRISENSFNGYRRIRPLMANLLKRFETLAVQNETYANRLRQLGAVESSITVTGSMKFDNAQTDRHNAHTLGLAEYFDIRDSQVVLIAGSTQEPEEAVALDCYENLKPEFPNLRLILVPRHKERFEDVARLVASRGHQLVRRSQPDRSRNQGEDSSPVCLLDTLGELGACWGLANVAFVGGSLTRRGGQNMIEPAAYGAAVLFGPNTWNFKDIVEQLLDGNAAQVISSAETFEPTVRELLTDDVARSTLGRNAKELVTRQSGAIEKTLRILNCPESEKAAA